MTTKERCAMIRKECKKFEKTIGLSEEQKKILQESKHGTHAVRLKDNKIIVSLDEHSILEPVLLTKEYRVDG